MTDLLKKHVDTKNPVVMMMINRIVQLDMEPDWTDTDKMLHRAPIREMTYVRLFEAYEDSVLYARKIGKI